MKITLWFALVLTLFVIVGLALPIKESNKPYKVF